MAGGGGGGMGATMGGRQGLGDDSYDIGPLDVTVELCGVINLFNPPDKTRIGEGLAGSQGQEGSSTEAAPVALALPTKAPPVPRGGKGMSSGKGGKGMGGTMGTSGMPN
jgi:hypothetical protein